MIKFEIAEKKDIPILIKLANEIWRLHFPGIISDEQIDYMLDKMYNNKIIGKEIEEGIIWKIIYNDNNPIGYISYSMINDRQCKLFKIYVHPELHGKGIGKTALKNTIDYAKSNNAKEVLLNVNRKNKKAIDAYLSYGFTIFKEEDIDFGNSFVLNDYVMALKLKDKK